MDAGGRGQWGKMPKRREGQKVCRIFYLESFVFTSWLIGTFD